MAKRNMLDIDPNALRAELKKRGLSLSAAGIETGHSASFISYVLKARRISRPAAIMLETKFNIPMGAYVAIEKNEARGAVEEPKPPIDYKKLYQCIYGAVYEAMKKALAGD